MIGGNLPGITRTASIAIYDDMQAFDTVSAGHASLVLLVISCVLVGFVHWLRRRDRWRSSWS
jgi:molybdate transport system permease protein